MIKDGGAADEGGGVGEDVERTGEVGKGVDGAEAEKATEEAEGDGGFERGKNGSRIDAVFGGVAENVGEKAKLGDVLTVDAKDAEPLRNVCDGFAE